MCVSHSDICVFVLAPCWQALLLYVRYKFYYFIKANKMLSLKRRGWGSRGAGNWAQKCPASSPDLPWIELSIIVYYRTLLSNAKSDYFLLKVYLSARMADPFHSIWIQILDPFSGIHKKLTN